jgi:hypothetical protein
VRDQAWLENLLKAIWEEHFHDVDPVAPIAIRFGKRARTRLGSLSYDKARKIAVIRVTALFKDTEVPEMVVKSTIVHELCHYAHGFNSGLERKYRHPHANGVIRAEFAERGLEDLYIAQRRWLKDHWQPFIKKHFPKGSTRPRRRYVWVRSI